MYRLLSLFLRHFQVIGLVMAVAGSGLAIALATEGHTGDALLAGCIALASVGFVALAGWMRRHAKKSAEFFAPKVR